MNEKQAIHNIITKTNVGSFSNFEFICNNILCTMDKLKFE
jgi:hypothetical protein